MKINGVEIKDFELSRRMSGAREVKAVYKGVFYCPGKALHDKVLMQVCTTKVSYEDEWGEKEWAEPVSEFKLFDGLIPFDSMSELIDFYNGNVQMKVLEIGKVIFNVSECGTVIMVGEKRKRIRTRRLKNQRLLIEVNAGNKTWSVRRLVALAWLGKPPKKKMRVLLNDGVETNLHRTNLYWNVGSHSTEEAIELAKYMNQ